MASDPDRHKGFADISFTYFEFPAGPPQTDAESSTESHPGSPQNRVVRRRRVGRDGSDARGRSNAAATSSSRRSAPCGATIWTPTGSPSAVSPAGTEMAGQPVTVMKYADRIQSR